MRSVGFYSIGRFYIFLCNNTTLPKSASADPFLLTKIINKDLEATNEK